MGIGCSIICVDKQINRKEENNRKKPKFVTVDLKQSPG